MSPTTSAASSTTTQCAFPATTCSSLTDPASSLTPKSSSSSPTTQPLASTSASGSCPHPTPPSMAPPVGMMSDSNSRTFLTKAISQAQAELASVTISTNGHNVSSTKEWVNQANYTQLDDAIDRAKLSFSLANSSSFLLDYQTYVLYQTLNGSSDDIGAEYAGFSYTGFENDEKLGTA
ncbi:hypothetical protein N7478_006708 [Penicillium angulare]|uniref:uncharacterized protein n=1 Tax=Penicillium angulare TaxID=116970 RepID=UPI002541D5E2|nr:uncharacterized protein N7478_006708 [Penicillium angulare]KAJ5281336.1 hypothetical protein N7478_006708 [Penicillium angulare]